MNEDLRPSPRYDTDEEVDQAVTKAVKNAIAEHARKGNQVVIWKDGAPVWVSVEPVKE